MRRDCERQKRMAARRRWMRSLRRGEPVHFGLSCQRCEMTPLVGVCYRCQACDHHVLCMDCYFAQDGSTRAQHPFEPVHGVATPANCSTGTRGAGAGSTSTLTFSVRTANAVAQPEDSGEQSDAALAAAEAAFMAVRSLALAPVGASGRSWNDEEPLSGREDGCSPRDNRHRHNHAGTEARLNSPRLNGLAIPLSSPRLNDLSSPRLNERLSSPRTRLSSPRTRHHASRRLHSAGHRTLSTHRNPLDLR